MYRGGTKVNKDQRSTSVGAIHRLLHTTSNSPRSHRSVSPDLICRRPASRPSRRARDSLGRSSQSSRSSRRGSREGSPAGQRVWPGLFTPLAGPRSACWYRADTAAARRGRQPDQLQPSVVFAAPTAARRPPPTDRRPTGLPETLQRRPEVAQRRIKSPWMQGYVVRADE